jgi:predicted Ser/Thr protein kinase/ribosomal protein L40E
MNPTAHCRRCGAELAPEAKTCSTCLFELALRADAPQPAPASEADSADSTGAPVTPPSLEEVAAALPDFDGFAPLGRGGMGAVFRAHERALDRTVAIKVLPRALGERADFRERFLREARALARLNHPSVVNVYGAGEAGGLCYLVMEFVDGRNLREILRERSVGAAEALRIVRALCDALQYTHDEGVVHRDIKPENVLVDRAGRVKLADFGLAKLVGADVGAHLTRIDQVMGTPHYMAPEQLERPHDVDHRADLFAVGVILYELLTGSLPRGAFELPSRRVAVDVRLDEIVLKALEREPARRYQHALEVKSDCDRIDTPADATKRARSPTEAAASAAAPWPPPGTWKGPLIAVVLCSLFWIGAAWSWNFGPGALVGAALVLLALVAALAHGQLGRSAEFRTSVLDATRGAWISRVASAALACGVGFLFVVVGHLGVWESGVTNWRPALRGANGLLESWRKDVWELARFCGLDPASLEFPKLAVTRSSTTSGLEDLAASGSWLLIAVGASLLVLAARSLLDTGGRRDLRGLSWRAAAECVAPLPLTLVALWMLAPVFAGRTSTTMSSVLHAFELEVAPGEAAQRIASAFESEGLALSVRQRTAVADGRSGAERAEVELLRAASSSPFDAWSTSMAGARRTTPRLWATVGGASGSTHARVRILAGLYRLDSEEAQRAQAMLARIQSRVERP